MITTEPASFSKEPPLQDTLEAILAGSGKTMETAEGLPSAAYTSQAFFNFEVEQMFKKDWICIGHVSQVPNVGDYYTVDLLDDLLVVVRGHDRIRVLSRVCLHRWASIVDGSGNATSFSCPFHGWGYGIDGQLKSAPFMQKANDFDLSTCRLPEIRTEVVNALGLIFVTSSKTISPISERIADLVEMFEPYHLSETVGVKPTLQEMPFNWKIYIETGQECYHHFAAHPQTLEPIRPTRLSWCEDGTDNWTVCYSALKPDIPQELAGLGLPNFPDLSDFWLRTIGYFHIFPLSRVFLRPDRVVLRCVYPLGPSKTLVAGLSLVRPEVAAQTELVEEKFALEAKRAAPQTIEDNAIDAAQMKGALSQFAQAGRLSHLEGTVWHQGEYVRRRVAEAAYA